MGIEFCAEAPSGHDIFQRMARVSASARYGTTFAFIFPEKKWVERRNIGGRWDNYNPLAIKSLKNISRFHKIPALSFFWEANKLIGKKSEGFLTIDKKHPNMPNRKDSEMKSFSKFVNLTIEYTINHKPFEQMMFDPFIIDREDLMWKKYHDRFRTKPDLMKWSPLTSCRIIKTSELINDINDLIDREPNLPQFVKDRKESLIYEPGSRIFRSDPYTGSLVGMDYLLCRHGETIRHRHRNLVMNFKNIKFKKMKKMFVHYYRKKCPFNPRRYKETDKYLTLHLKDGCRYTKQKELRIFCYIADILMFKDAVLF